MPRADADDVILTSAALTVRIARRGAELQALTTAAGEDLLWDGDPAVWHGRAPVLFPVIGVMNGGGYWLDGVRYGMPKHGFARHSEFTLVECDAGSARLQLGASGDTRSTYPFEFQLDLAFALAGPSLTVTAEIANLGTVPMPASFGFHPALRWPLPFGQPRADHIIRFAQSEPAPVRRIDNDGLLRPAGVASPVAVDRLALRDDLFVDDAMIFDALNSREVTYGAPNAPCLRVRFADFPVLGVWTKPGADFICIEPWAGVSEPEGFAGDLRDKPGIFTIAPGKVRRLTMEIMLELTADLNGNPV